MGEGNGERKDLEFVTSIDDDVMNCLLSRGFFEELDNRLCPRDDSTPRILCDHSYGISKSILEEIGFHAEDLGEIFDVLRSRGGFCDCEILYNAIGESRLKAEYWKSKAGDASSPKDAE